ncbi:hypothetical protein FIBSPDRAFT_1039559 [Athelia psychrophila]|uniref:Thioesterase/thiol ester dehydrase-isomerase n=1 Tax=Athelia psychrophila TaxID=1759441 RepID=A0A166RMJ8_9AGAM|nr:hypothetical protein FIBSPDRAFT_1039559 [Fibularhizoctonia sp. CBS 109695]
MPVNTQAALVALRGLPLILRLSGSPKLKMLLTILPAVFKYASLLLLLLNIRSVPLAWHARVFRPLVALQWRYYWLRLRIIFKSRKQKELAVGQWFEELLPVGLSPFDSLLSYKTRATLDDSDFNGHLSNSSYAKTYDLARMKTALAYFPSFFRVGGWIALGATHYHFLREIPLLHNYEVRLRVGSWDQKWFYVVARFVTHSKPKKSHSKASIEGKIRDGTPPTDDSLSAGSTFHASLRTPADGLETPAPTTPSGVPPSDISAADAMKAIAAAQMVTEEPDGATVNCIAVSELCFKHGRITVPPSIVLASSGFSSPSPEGEMPYSHANPPPHWAEARKLVAPRASKEYVKFLRGGWRDVPEAERWWVDALSGSVEERRKVHVEEGGAMGALRKGMQGAGSV